MNERYVDLQEKIVSAVLEMQKGTKMPEQWQYYILGWELNNSKTEQENT